MKGTDGMTKAVELVGRTTNRQVVNMGEAFSFGSQAVGLGITGLFRPKIYQRRELIHQLEATGARSLPIIILVATLIGMTFVAQTTPTLANYGGTRFVAGIVGVSITRTLGPVLTAIVFTGRVGAAYTAELGTMKVSDELLALETMGISPVGFLAAPRVIAATVALVALTIVFDLCALLSAYGIATLQYGIDPQVYIDVTHGFVDIWDFGYGVFKAIIFAVIIAVVSCYKGFNVKGSGIDVGKATMESVVICLISIIFADFILSLGYNVLLNTGFIPA